MDEFSDIAFAKLLQMLPELGNYIVTFQDVSEELNDESGMQVGVFVMNINGKVAYVPVVAKASNVYPIDSIFFKEMGEFFPLSRKTMPYILGLGSSEPGKLTKIPKTVIGNPSVYELITPPRTGKFTSASQSRLVEFLSALPDDVKAATFEKIASDQTLYESLDEMYGLKTIFDVMQPQKTVEASASPETHQDVVIYTAQSEDIPLEKVAEVMENGYAVNGVPSHTRIAISQQDFNESGQYSQVSSADGDRDYNIVFSNGESRSAFIPKIRSQGSSNPVAIFTNGDYAVTDSFISVGESPTRRSVLLELFETAPPLLMRDIYRDDTFMVMLSDTTFLGPFRAESVVMNHLGIQVSAYNLAMGSTCTIYAYRGFQGEFDRQGSDLFIPSSSVVVKLNKNVTYNLEQSAFGAERKQMASRIQLLGDELNLGYDGIEFFLNGKSAGAEVDMMNILTNQEGIHPSAASSFIKQAKVSKSTKIYLTKRAFSTDIDPSASPSFGLIPNNPSDKVGPTGGFNSNVQSSMGVQDPQITEATIISELLQIQNMFEEIPEYLPDIKNAVDKLGRVLFLARVRFDTLSNGNDTDEIYSFLAGLKNVYQMLGINYVKLLQLSSSHNAMSGKVGRK